MATNDVRTIWQRTAANRIQEDTLRAPKLAHCPILPKNQPDVCHPGAVRGVENIPSFYWSKSWGSIDTKIPWQMSPFVHCDYRSEYLAIDEVLGSRFMEPTGLQAVAVERSINLKSGNPGVMGVTCEHTTRAELELEWQLIVDPKPKGGPFASSPAAKKQNSDNNHQSKEGQGASVEDITSKDERCPQKSTIPRSLQASGASSAKLSTAKDIETLMLNHHNQECSEEHQHIKRKVFYGSQSPTPSSMGSSVSWRTANKEALAALVAKKAAERLENCDLPRPLSKSVLRTPLPGSCHTLDAQLNPSNFSTRNVMASSLQGGDQTRLECLGVQASPIFGNSGKSSQAWHFSTISQPVTIPIASHASAAMCHGCQSFSGAENRGGSWSAGEKVTSSSLGISSSPLGEALCHSQTRAREAEKQAGKSTQDYQKISQLFFREASLSLTYRQWVSSLQAENILLKMCFRHQHAANCREQSFFAPFAVLDRLSDRWRNYGKECAQRQMREHFPAAWPMENEATGNFVIIGQDGAKIIMGYTLNFAFALGLGLAGAGLMLGWSMGWILFAY